MPIAATATDHLVVALAYDGLCTFEFGITAEVFGLERPEMGDDWYSFTTCAERPGRLATNAGLAIHVDHGLDMLSAATTIVIPGWRSDGAAPSDPLRNALLNAHARGARLVSICSGAFLLAATGLLDGRRATTHWRYAKSLQTAHPAVVVDADTLYAGDDRIFTSAGSAAGIDLLLHLVRLDFGPDAANIVARRLVVAAHRSGGQAQFIERPVLTRPDGVLRPLLDRLRSDPAARWTIGRMARTAAMSERTLARRFREETGESPLAWLTAQRLALARDLLETTNLSMEHIADRAGMGTATNLRLHFTSTVGIPPNLYRKQFRRADA
ncbi:transcriptional regulator FtrA [uncultured Sphingomonas sp.]|jgi:AraC family transcriptional regulator, transcriptional activator FtrA|uniref:transcriptional regulator FtrA n=1 Tax=uncultured Sphingomonas sp. TaxID=158754 RepID=UPI0030DA6087